MNRDMKKALIVSSTGGFLSQFLENDVKILQEKGYEVHYASDFNNPVYEFDPELLKQEGIVLWPITLHKKPWHIMTNAKGLSQLSQIIKEENISLVHCHNPVGGMLGRLAGFFSGKKPYVIYTAHGFHFFKGAPLSYWLIFYPVERFLAHFTDMIITINREDYDRASRFFLKRGGCVELLHGVGLNTERFHPRENIRAEVRYELGIPDNAFHIVTAAELNGNKNQMVILKAINKLADKNIYYSICGRGGNCEALAEYIENNNLASTCKLRGYRTDMERILQSADVFAFPSKREGFGMAAVEALGCGVPVIAADNRGTREYMKNGENGIVCDADDYEAFANAIYTLQHDESLRKTYSQRALALSHDFTKDAANLTMRQIYNKIPD